MKSITQFSSLLYPKRLINVIIIIITFHPLTAQDTANPADDTNGVGDCADQVVLDVNLDNHSGGFLRYTEAMMRKDFAGGDIKGGRGLGHSFPQKNMVGNGMIKANYPKGAMMGAYRSGFIFQRAIPNTEEAYMEYRVKFDPGFEWKAGGKLPGLGGNDPSKKSTLPMGCTTNQNNIKNGFTARLMWRKNGELVVYTYFPDRKKKCGEDISIGRVSSGKWITIRQYIKLNTSGKRDGLLRVYIDGKLALDRNNIMYRTNPNVKINYAVIHTYRGGAQGNTLFYASKEYNSYFDDFKVTANCPVAGGEVYTEEDAQEALEEAMNTTPTEQEIDDSIVPYEDAPPLPETEDVDLNNAEQIDVGVLDIFESIIIPESTGNEVPTTPKSPGSWKYQKNTKSIAEVPVPLKIPTDYIKKIDNALKLADNTIDKANIAAKGIPYLDGIGAGIREVEKKFVDNYTKASRKTTTQFGAIAVTTETQFYGRQKLGLKTLKNLNFQSYKNECGNYFLGGKVTKCQQKVNYLEKSMQAVDEVIDAYSLADNDMNNGISEQIREKYLVIYNKISNELEKIRLDTEKALTIKKMLKK